MITVGVSAGGTSRFPQTPSTGPLRGRPLRGSRGHLFQRCLDLGEDLVLAAGAVDRDEVPTDAVVLDQRLRLPVVVVEPPLDRLVGVVRAPFQLGALPQPLERNLI